MKKYSSIQRWDILPNRYRVKNYTNKKWEYIEQDKGKWIFKGIPFSNATLLKQHLNVENKMYNLERN
jgi:hypothetical protein